MALSARLELHAPALPTTAARRPPLLLNAPLLRLLWLTVGIAHAGGVPEHYVRKARTNCYAGHGGVPLGDNSGWQKEMSVEECAALCDKSLGCTGFVHEVRPTGGCWLRVSTNIFDCDANNLIDTYQRSDLIMVQTALYSGDRMAQKAVAGFGDGYASEQASNTIEIDSSDTDQEILGFGGAFTESSAVVFKNLTRELQEEVIERYFGKDRGIGYTMGRVHINSCDFSVSSYSFDDEPEDFSLAHFDGYVTRDTKALIPLINAAKQRVEAGGRALRLLATPWSPPAWMKTSNNMLGSHRPGLRQECSGVWAQYIAKWITAYKNHGIHVWALSVQNEPLNVPGWEACTFSAEEEADFLGYHLGPTIKAAHPEIGIFVYDDYPHLVHAWANTIYSHPAAGNFATGVAFHWYGGDNFDQIKRVRTEYPHAVLLPSEATYERFRWGPRTTIEYGEWAFGEGYAHDIMGNLNAGAAGWLDWNLLLDPEGGPNHVGNVCDAAMMADTKSQRLHVHPQYFFMGHFSKYIVPGSRRIRSSVTGSKTFQGGRPYGTCNGDDGLQATAFLRPDRRIATVVLNCGKDGIDFKLRDGTRSLQASIPGHAIQTYIFDSLSSPRTLMPQPVTRKGYVEHPNRNCYTGNGGIDLDDYSTAPANQSPTSCKALCDSDPRCDCVTLSHGDGRCFRRSNCDPKWMSRDTRFATFLKTHLIV